MANNLKHLENKTFTQTKQVSLYQAGVPWTVQITCEGSSNLLQGELLISFGEIHDRVNTVCSTQKKPFLMAALAARILDEIPYAICVEIWDDSDNKITVKHNNRMY